MRLEPHPNHVSDLILLHVKLRVVFVVVTVGELGIPRDMGIHVVSVYESYNYCIFSSLLYVSSLPPSVSLWRLSLNALYALTCYTYCPATMRPKISKMFFL